MVIVVWSVVQRRLGGGDFFIYGGECVKKLTLKVKLLATFIVVSLIPLLLVTFLAVKKASDSLQAEAIAKLSAVQEAKRNHLRYYFDQVNSAVGIIKQDPNIFGAMQSFGEAFVSAGNTVDDEAWRTLVEFKEGSIITMVEKYGFYDLLMISRDGYIVYSTKKGKDLGMKIPDSELASTSLGKAFAMIGDNRDEIVFSDFADYPSKGGEQAAFMAMAMRDRFDRDLGYAAIRIPAETLNSIVQQRSGMGETSESFLVGRNGDRMTLRTDRVVQDGRTGDEVSGEFIAKGLAGESGFAFEKGANGERRFVHYDPVEIYGTSWAMVTTGAAEDIFGVVDSLRNQMLVVIVVTMIVVVMAALATTALVIKPIKGTVEMLKDIAQGEGDLTKRLAIDTRDEMGEMAHWFNIFMEKLQGIVRQIAADATSLGGASQELSAISGKMSSGVESISGRTNQVAAASEEMSGNMTSVAAASEQAATNVNMVASATEEMTVTVREIAQHTENAREVTGNAVGRATEASAKIHELGQAAAKIGSVTETITEISEQTNLLALNATIEAARAGEAGKGFAVVANEIKELARQTASATQEIKTQIEGVQNSTDTTVRQIEEITTVINKVDEIVAIIARAVEEQASASQEIADNVSQASLGIQEVNSNVNQSSSVAGSISGDIVEVNVSVKEIAGFSGLVNAKSEELATLADKLNGLMNQFKV